MARVGWWHASGWISVYVNIRITYTYTHNTNSISRWNIASMYCMIVWMVDIGWWHTRGWIISPMRARVCGSCTCLNIWITQRWRGHRRWRRKETHVNFIRWGGRGVSLSIHTSTCPHISPSIQSSYMTLENHETIMSDLKLKNPRVPLTSRTSEVN